MASFNSGYLKTNRGIIKLIQIVLGIIVCILLCGTWYGGSACFPEGRIGIASGVNFIVLIINIVFFILNLLSLNIFKVEKLYTIIACIAFLIICALLIWTIIVHNDGRQFLIIATILLVIIFLLFLWDVKIVMGEASN